MNVFTSHRVYKQKADFHVKWGFIGATKKGKARLVGSCGHYIEAMMETYKRGKVSPVCGKCEEEYFKNILAGLPSEEKKDVINKAQQLAATFKFVPDVDQRILDMKRHSIYVERRFVRHSLSNYDSQFQQILNQGERGDILIYKVAKSMVDEQIRQKVSHFFVAGKAKNIPTLKKVFVDA